MMSVYQKIFRITAGLLLLASLNACQTRVPSNIPTMTLTKVKFNQLAYWQEDDHTHALAAFKRSCSVIHKMNAKAQFSPIKQAGKVKSWQKICSKAEKVPKHDNVAARKFFETWFEPYQVGDRFNPDGLFTAYYLPLLQVSSKPDARYNVPIYARPTDLTKLFKHGRSMVVQIKNNRYLPYPDRAAIKEGAIHKTAPVLFWGNNEIDVFFAQIQGSAIVQLPNQKQFVIGYAGTNGHPYTSIGKVLVEKGALTMQTVSMQTIRAWLDAHPDQLHEILNTNASYVFFKILKDDQPVGTQQVPLTPKRSLAIDTRYIPLGAPIWLNTNLPHYDNAEQWTPFNQLLIAQDTGGAIKGIVRGDIYLGGGEQATFIAGHMNNLGQYWLLLPS